MGPVVRTVRRESARVPVPRDAPQRRRARSLQQAGEAEQACNAQARTGAYEEEWGFSDSLSLHSTWYAGVDRVVESRRLRIGKPPHRRLRGAGQDTRRL